jgi:hypothetical protein
MISWGLPNLSFKLHKLFVLGSPTAKGGFSKGLSHGTNQSGDLTIMEFAGLPLDVSDKIRYRKTIPQFVAA